MTNRRENWGHCAHCAYFGSPAVAPLDREEAACKEPKHAKHELRVIGTSGCNKFELRHGLSKAVEGSRLRA